MSFVQVRAQLSIEELLEAVSQLSKPDLEQLVQQALALRAQRQAPSLPHAEAELLQKINQGIPPQTQDRYTTLIAKRKAAALTTDEYAELLQLTDHIENLEARRMEYLTELARLRQVSLDNLMQQLGVRPPEYA